MTQYKTVVNVPKISNPSLSVRLFYEQTEIGTAEICGIFGCCRNKSVALKARAREQMEMDGVMSFSTRAVNVVSAYKSWGIDVKRLENGMNRPKLRMTEAVG